MVRTQVHAGVGGLEHLWTLTKPLGASHIGCGGGGWEGGEALQTGMYLARGVQGGEYGAETTRVAVVLVLSCARPRVCAAPLCNQRA